MAPTRIFALTILGFAALLSSCASQQGLVQSTQQNLDTLNTWQINGKLGFRSPQKNGSAWIKWRQADSAYQLRLNGPFGSGTTVINGSEDIAVLQQQGQEDIVATSGEELSNYLFGWAFPVAEMQFWVKGQAATGSPAQATYDDNNILTALEQKGWQLSFENYQQQNTWMLPQKIKGQKDDYGFTLVIKQWQPSPEILDIKN